MSEMPIVTGLKEARFPHLRHAGPTATSSSYHRHACYEYIRWAVTTYGFGDCMSRYQRPISTTTTSTTTITNPLLIHLLLLNQRPPLLARTIMTVRLIWYCLYAAMTDKFK
ncbi:PREDICTED: uncharacterized protein LOC105361594 [Ceratosolen solmsi marchali]|uniref:Uncharacterized protein LOC105361594 n=1 Tax=Ceratosolen solmsi marchali TaxID=326594 RepID=A0AAJ6YFJ4_9HYME|nr:PREDICTED: uncharacterized protein LOC105361594 [Ceratosolen solmsi marchali]